MIIIQPEADFKPALCVRVFSLDRQLADLKRRRSALIASLKSPAVEVIQTQKRGENKSSHFTSSHLLGLSDQDRSLF